MREGIILIFLLLFSKIHAQIQEHHAHPALPLGYPCTVIPEQELMPLDHHCHINVTCTQQEKDSFYSNLDGTCNNLEKSIQGGVGTDFLHLTAKRVIIKKKNDLRLFVDSNDHELPNARLVSTLIHGQTDIEDTNGMSLMTMQFGQFLDHDLTLTAEAEMCHKCGEEPIGCCDYFLQRKNYTLDEMPDNCWPIIVPENDPVFQGTDAPKCLEFKRSQRSACRSPRHGLGNSLELFNEVTHYIDASNIYGSSRKSLKDLRHGIHGVLEGNETSIPWISYLLPDETETCEDKEEELKGFRAGDLRVNENPGLTAMHTVFAREHNRIASKIKTYSRHKTDASIMFEARRYVIGEMQNIVYGEFLPSILPKSDYIKYNLNPVEPSQYQANVSSSISVEFSTAAFRMGHTLVSSLIQLFEDMKNEEEASETEDLDSNFFNPTLIKHNRFLGRIFRGLTRQKSGKLDSSITDSLRNKLFREKTATFGSDLAALNIQRGRDHSLGSYDQARIYCGLDPLPESFNEFIPKEIPEEVWTTFQSLYESPGDIELFPAGLSETPNEPGKLGPTFSCLIAEQFQRLRIGDRFFFTHSNVDKIDFCPSDVEFLRHRTLRDIICENTDIEALPLSVFQVPSASNPVLECNQQAHPLEPQELCLFGSDRQANKLQAPGYVSRQNSLAEEEVVVIAGGFDGASLLNSVEVYSTDGFCSGTLPSLPISSWGLGLFFANNTLFACGGEQGSQCFKIHSNSNAKWWTGNHDLRMNKPRLMGATTVSNKGIIYISGGWPHPSSFEYMDQFQASWNYVPNELPRMRHCMVTLDNGNVVLIGGHKSGYSVDMFDTENESWRTLPDLAFYLDRHDCILLPKDDDGQDDQVLIVGQYSHALVYNIQTGETVKVGRPLLKRGFSKLVRVNSGIFVLGGDYHTQKVEEFDVKTGKFRLASESLIKGRSRFACTTVTKEFIKGFALFDCQ